MTTIAPSLSLLKAQKKYPKFYFNDGEQCIVSAGAKKSHEVLLKSDHLCVGGFDFFRKKHKEHLWEAFKLSSFFEPEELNYDLEELPLAPIGPWRKCHHSPELPYYEGLVERGRIPGGKVVFARRTTLTYDDTVDPYAHLARFGTGIRFLYSPREGVAFIGATPEPLFRRSGDIVTTTAIAGTRKRGKTPEEDRRLRNELLSNTKELTEFAFVSRFIEQSLQSVCISYESSDIDIVQTPTVQHLRRTFTGKLREIDDYKLLNLLHPTPATGGYPKEKALETIYDLEPFDRGYYASPIGYSSPEKSSFAVALRSSLIIDNEMHLFAGTGIVDGSQVDLEWEELNHKIRAYL